VAIEPRPKLAAPLKRYLLALLLLDGFSLLW
jgi:hypothetical protein